MTNKIRCPECGKYRIWRKGDYPSRTGPKLRCVCRDCGRTFNDPYQKTVKKSKPGRKRAV